ncbi:MAG: cation:dicarboxylase symporter family transporter [Erythrobacter sp.]|nr:cation:dicarboxylase symporter family transporter [Erythrobacter sp.]
MKDRILLQDDAAPAMERQYPLVTIRLPVALTFGALVGGLVLGMTAAGTGLPGWIEQVARLVGSLWLRALQMTIIPLVAALLVLGLAQMVAAARAGRVARVFLALVAGALVTSGTATMIAMPLLLEAFPIPPSASAFLAEVPEQTGEVPGILDFLGGMIAPNIIAAAAETAMLPLTIFFALFAIALTRLPADQGERLLAFFHALANAMLVIIGWVLRAAPVGVLGLAFGVGLKSGGGAFAALGHYILAVSAMGAIVLLLGYVVAGVLGGIPPWRFAAAVLPAQAVALSTQSSLASLPAMLDSASRLGLRASTAEFVLPLAVAIFRATSPAMNLAVALYVAALAGVEITPGVAIIGILVALVISVGSVSLPGSISFVVSIGPIALAMGVPIEPLALLVAVEMLPDLMRTLANVTMNVAVTSAVDRSSRRASGSS